MLDKLISKSICDDCPFANWADEVCNLNTDYKLLKGFIFPEEYCPIGRKYSVLDIIRNWLFVKLVFIKVRYFYRNR